MYVVDAADTPSVDTAAKVRAQQRRRAGACSSQEARPGVCAELALGRRSGGRVQVAGLAPQPWALLGPSSPTTGMAPALWAQTAPGLKPLPPPQPQELHALLERPSLDGIPLLVLGNKNDLPGALSTQQLIERLGLQARTR